MIGMRTSELLRRVLQKKPFAVRRFTHPPNPEITRQGCHLLELRNIQPETGPRNQGLLDGEKQQGAAGYKGNCGIYSKSMQIKLDQIHTSEKRASIHSQSPSDQITFKDPDCSNFSTLTREDFFFFLKGLGSGPRHIKRIEEQTEHMLAQKYSTYCNETQLQISTITRVIIP